MAAWLIEHIWWLAAGMAAVLVGIKVALGMLFRRLATTSEQAEP